jgi:tetratricopeptide (TPR) repeat protein
MVSVPRAGVARMTEGTWRDAIALGHAARRGGRAEEALAHYRAALALAPDHAETNSVCGLMLLELDRTDEAAPLLRRAVDLDPSSPAARANLAELLARTGDIASAIALLEALASEAPAQWWIWERLGELEAGANRFADAALHFRHAVERKPNDPSLLFKCARANFDAGRRTEARALLDRAAELAPGHGAILRLYAEMHESDAAWDDLAATARSWLGADPQNPLPWMFAARAQWETGYLTEARQSYRTFLERGGTSATNLATYGRLCMTALAYDEAARALDEAEQLDPQCAHMLSAKATLAMYAGRFDDALAYARRAIAADPRDGAAFRVLVQVCGGRVAEEEYASLARLAEDAGARAEDRIAASFALADCLDAQGDVDVAFAAYEQANELCVQRALREGIGYDRLQRERQVEWLMSAFAAAPPADRKEAGPTPIFVVGMPRSGTTLVESIVGAHSDVLACGERQGMRTIMQAFASPHGTPAPVITEAMRQRWRDAYRRELPPLRGAVAVTDKNPWNFDALGMIFVLFPLARVVHVRRDPVETGLSIFRNAFPKFASFANRLPDIGHYYGQYSKLMAHWQGVLGDRFLTIRYEDLVTDFDRAAPDLLRFCGLEWQEACRRFPESDRIIGTMSAVQARQPLAALRGRGSRYARHLSPLLAALREAGVDPHATSL